MIDPINAMFAITCASGAISLGCIVGIAHARLQLNKSRAQHADTLQILAEEQAESAHFRELTDDALANIEHIEAELRKALASAGRWAGKWANLYSQVRRETREREDAAAKRADHMRQIGILGNKSPKRRKAPVPAE